MSKQIVKLFKDQDTMGVQSVSVDLKEQWLNVIHDGNEISLSVENWIKLVVMVNATLPNGDESILIAKSQIK